VEKFFPESNNPGNDENQFMIDLITKTILNIIDDLEIMNSYL
jgi:hypothetical protein